MDANRASEPIRPVTTAKTETAHGDLARAAFDRKQAVEHYQKALEEMPADDVENRIETLFKMSVTLVETGESTEALIALSEALRLDDRSDACRTGRLLLQKARTRRITGHHADAARHADEAEQVLAGDHADTVEYGDALLLKGTLAYHEGDYGEALRRYQAALVPFKNAGDLTRLARGYRNVGMIHRRAGRWGRALEHFQVAQNLLSMEGAYGPLAAVSQSVGMLHFQLGNLDEARNAYGEALRIGREVNDPRSTALALLGLGQVDLARGDLAEARTQFWSALEIALLRHHLYAVSVAYCRLARVSLLEDRVPEAREACDKAREVAGRGAAGREESIETALVHVEVLIAEGKVADAHAVATEAVETARAAGERALEAGALVAHAKASAAAGRAEAATESFGRAHRIVAKGGDRARLAEVKRLFGAHLLHQDADRARLEGMQHLLEAREAYHRLGVWDTEAHILLDLAEEELRQRAVDRAQGRMDRVRSLTRDHARRPKLDERLAELAGRLEVALAENAMATRDSYDVHRRMERILRSDRPFDEKLIAFLKALDGTVPFDGAALLSRRGRELLVVGSIGLDRDAGSRLDVPSALDAGSWASDGRPLVFLGLHDADKRSRLGALATGRALETALAIPLAHGDEGGILYLDRQQGSARREFNQTDVSSGMALTQQLSGFLEEAVLRNQRGLRDIESTRNNLALADIVTENREMLAILGLVSRVADSDLTLLLQGETGTGKKLLAHALHQCSPRADKPFVTVDCAALPESVLESELFGHVKGAFTGAITDRAGLLTEADGGTIFLDEIDKTDIAVQRRFLHLLDCGEVRPVGGRAYRRLDIRVVCATSAADLRQEVEEGRFIKDLYYRLNDVSVQVPPLRRRKEDIRLLADYFTDLYAQEIEKNVPGVSQLAMKRLVDYDWPGNVREFEKVMRRAITLADDGETIGIDLLPPRLLEDEGATGPLRPARTVTAGSAGGTLREQVESLERQLVLDTLEETGWNKSRTAQLLGLTRKGLKNKIARYEIDRRATVRDDD